MGTPDDIPRRASGERPYFFDDPAIDQLYAVLLALAGELSVAWDRIDALERLLVARDVLAPGEVAGFVPDEAATAERAARRRGTIERLFRVLTPEGTSLAPAADMPEITRIIAELKQG
jgi:hypothetical protein